MAPNFFACFRRGGVGGAKEASANAGKVHTAGGGGGAEEQGKGGAVLVEFFTAQGCATSPEAELFLSRLGSEEDRPAEGPPVIVLAYHVEYWDHLGWKDPLASSLWSARQKALVEALGEDSIYTPQSVVQGRSQCLATGEAAVLEDIGKATTFPGPTMQATFQRRTPDTLEVSLRGALRTKVDEKGVDVMVALHESGLVTEISRGDNKGCILKNDFVVRKLEKLCSVRDVSAKKTISGTVNFTLWEGFNSGKCGIVVFIQNSSLQIFGCQQFHLPLNL
ncbi:hypothetical protein EJ110_NYTH42882 [Nymphaea thermarum]|nr:hypothetical protein EJ110_NYTH42882 [Nymphaea thermarum]